MLRLRTLRLPVVGAAALLGAQQHTRLARPTLRCETAPATLVGQERGRPLIDAHQFATGSVLGIVTGMLVRRLGKLFLLVLVGAATVLRMLEGSRVVPGLDELGNLITKARRLILNRSRTADATTSGEGSVTAWLQRDLSFKGAFTALFLIGLVNT